MKLAAAIGTFTWLTRRWIYRVWVAQRRLCVIAHNSFAVGVGVDPAHGLEPLLLGGGVDPPLPPAHGPKPLLSGGPLRNLLLSRGVDPPCLQWGAATVEGYPPLCEKEAAAVW